VRPINETRLKTTYEYILGFQAAYGRTPTFREIMRDCDYVSISTVKQDITRLKERGFLSKDKEYSSISLIDKAQVGSVHGAGVLGSVRCGQPGLAVEDLEYTVALPNQIFGNKEQFILHAKGPSMIKKGIFDGDLIVVTKQETAAIGDIVVALIDDEATVKELAKTKDGAKYLKAANDDRDYDVYPEGDFKILGIVRHTIHTVKDVDLS